MVGAKTYEIRCGSTLAYQMELTWVEASWVCMMKEDHNHPTCGGFETLWSHLNRTVIMLCMNPSQGGWFERSTSKI